MAGRSMKRRTLLGLAMAGSLLLAGSAEAKPKAAPLTVIATIVAKPDQADAIRATLTKFAASTRAEKGCISYTLYEDQAQPGRFYTYESWADDAALTAHLTSPAMQAAGATFGPMLAGAPVISKLKKL